MKSFYLTSLALALGLAAFTGVARAQSGGYGSPSLLPMPQANYRYPTTQASAVAPQAAPQTAPQGGWNTYYTGTPPMTPQAAGAAPSPSDHVELLPQTHGHYGDYGHGGAPCADGSCNNDYMNAMQAPWSGCNAVGCGPHGGVFAGAAGLIMGRGTGNAYFFSFFDANEAAQLLDTRDTIEWGGGAEAWVGKWFGCGQFGVEGVYWGLYPGTGESNLLAGQFPGNLNAILNFDQLNYNGFTADQSTNAAVRHRLRTDYQAHSAEINFLGSTGPYGPYGTSRFTWLAGFRYFRFDDNLEFASDPIDTNFTGAAPEIYYNIDVDNNLYGFQLGGRGEIFVSQRMSLDLGTKFGVFGNHINHHSRIGGSAGDAVINNGPFNGQPFNVTSTADSISFLGELKAGASYWLTNNWRITGGYRAVGITGLALAADQIPLDLRGINDVDAVDTDGSLILHGAYAGAEFTW
jgi:hypothetical protein